MIYWYTAEWTRFDGSDTDPYGEPCESGTGFRVEYGYIVPSWSYGRADDEPYVTRVDAADVLVHWTEAVINWSSPIEHPDYFRQNGSIRMLRSGPQDVDFMRSPDKVDITLNVDCTDLEWRRIVAYAASLTEVERRYCHCGEVKLSVPADGWDAGESHPDGTPAEEECRVGR